MVEIHFFWILMMVIIAYLAGMIVGWYFTADAPREEDRPMAIKKDFADDDYMQQVYGDIPSWLRRQAD